MEEGSLQLQHLELPGLTLLIQALGLLQTCKRRRVPQHPHYRFPFIAEPPQTKKNPA